MIRKLDLAGADAFRINMSHGDQTAEGEARRGIRALEKEFHRPTTILFDLQGPKLRVGHFEGGRAVLKRAAASSSIATRAPATTSACIFPTPNCSKSVKPGTNILIDDGKVRLRVLEADERPDRQRSDGRRSSFGQQGRQRPRRARPNSGTTDKDRDDLQFALDQRADWIASRSFSGPRTLPKRASLIGERASLLAKIEKPAAIDRLNDIIALADAVMVARGDLGVELPPEASRRCRTRSSPALASSASRWSSRRRCSN